MRYSEIDDSSTHVFSIEDGFYSSFLIGFHLKGLFPSDEHYLSYVSGDDRVTASINPTEFELHPIE